MASPLYHESNPSSSSSKVYDTIVTAAGRLECNCRGWTVLKNGKARECTHTGSGISQNKGIVAKFGLRTIRDGDYWNVDPRDFPKLGGKAPMPFTGTPKPTSGATRKPTKSTMIDGVSIIEYDDDENEDEPVKFHVPEPVPTPVVPYVPKPDAADFIWVDPNLAEKLPDGESIEPFYTEPRQLLWAMEEKFDGERITLAVSNGNVKAWNRPQRGKAAGVNDLTPEIVAAAAKLQNGTYDGELYIPGGTSSDVRLLENADKKKLVLFDLTRLLNQDITNQTYDQRRGYLEVIFKNLEASSVLFLAASVVPDPAFLRDILHNGGEGVMLKRRAARYLPGKRTVDLIKIKTKQHATMIVTGFEAGKLGPYARLKLRNPLDGSTTTVKTLDNATLRAIAKNPERYLHRRCVIEFQFRTADNNYRHPMFDRWEDE